MNKKLLVFSFVICSTILMASCVSAADAFVFTDVSDAKLLTIDTSGNTNATGWLAENGIKLSETYCALTGCAFTGEVSSNSNITTTEFFVGDGRYLTNIEGINASWTQAYAETLFTNKTYVDNQDIAFNTSITNYIDTQDGIFNDSAAAYTLYVNETMKSYVDTQISGIGGMDYTNLALINISNTFTPMQNFSAGINTDKVNALSAGAITFKAGV